jgi:hypothetical protein
MKRVTITAAKEIANKFDKDQVIIISFSKKDGQTWVTTYGRTVEDCQQAAEGGNKLKRAMNWPEELCNEMPQRAVCQCGHDKRYHKTKRCQFTNYNAAGEVVFSCICSEFCASKLVRNNEKD